MAGRGTAVSLAYRDVARSDGASVAGSKPSEWRHRAFGFETADADALRRPCGRRVEFALATELNATLARLLARAFRLSELSNQLWWGINTSE